MKQLMFLAWRILFRLLDMPPNAWIGVLHDYMLLATSLIILLFEEVIL